LIPFWVRTWHSKETKFCKFVEQINSAVCYEPTPWHSDKLRVQMDSTYWRKRLESFIGLVHHLQAKDPNTSSCSWITIHIVVPLNYTASKQHDSAKKDRQRYTGSVTKNWVLIVSYG
jgi:hypothetical protein